MREILFRGKSDDFGEWVEGSLLHDPDLEQYLIFGFDYYNGVTGLERDEFCYHVIPSTIGQYTGLLDRNGKKIFEGDIIKIGNKTRYVFFGVCRYRHTNYGEYAVDLSVKDGSNCEVIGNIHDNHELLEQEG